MRRLCIFVSTASMVVTTFGCGAASTTGTTTTDANCRTYPTTQRLTIGSAGNATLTCSFDQSSFVYTCSGAATTLTTRYGSLADFVDEAHTVGRVLAQSRTQLFFSGPSGATTFTYDGQRRLTRETLGTATGPPTESTSYSAWDAQGRPTVGAFLVQAGTSCSGVTTFAYDEGARSATRTAVGTSGCAGRTTYTLTYDADGSLISDSGLYAYAILSTARICK